MEHIVVCGPVVARPTAVLAATTTWREYPDVWRRLLDKVHANLVWLGTGHKGRNIMLYRDDVPNVEVGVELDQPAEFGAPVVGSTLPAGEVAMTVHRGPYEALGAAHEAVLAWCAENDRTVTRTRWEVYGHHREDPAERTTEVYWLLA